IFIVDACSIVIRFCPAPPRFKITFLVKLHISAPDKCVLDQSVVIVNVEDVTELIIFSSVWLREPVAEIEMISPAFHPATEISTDVPTVLSVTTPIESVDVILQIFPVKGFPCIVTSLPAKHVDNWLEAEFNSSVATLSDGILLPVVPIRRAPPA